MLPNSSVRTLLRPKYINTKIKRQTWDYLCPPWSDIKSFSYFGVGNVQHKRVYLDSLPVFWYSICPLFIHNDDSFSILFLGESGVFLSNSRGWPLFIFWESLFEVVSMFCSKRTESLFVVLKVFKGLRFWVCVHRVNSNTNLLLCVWRSRRVVIGRFENNVSFTLDNENLPVSKFSLRIHRVYKSRSIFDFHLVFFGFG